MVGNGELLRECRDFAAQHHLPVSFAGFLNQAEIARAYVSADCLVLPSDTGETWGLVVNEAMACGLPAIVSDQVGCQPDLITRGVTGDVYQLGNTEELAALLGRYATDSEKLTAMGNEARKRVEKDYSYERVVEGTLAALHYVTGKG
jgi:glycosyltransferase involved in cell wall biosynthesis